MPYTTADTDCANISPGSSTEPSAYCQYLIEGESICLCETNARHPYYIKLEAGRGEEIVVFHTERFIDAVMQQAGVPQPQKTDYALVGQYRDVHGRECAMIVLLELVDRLDNQIEHKVAQCDAAYEFFCQKALNFQDFHDRIPAAIYQVFR